MSDTKPAPPPPQWKPLGELEQTVLALLWRNRTLTADEIRERLAPHRVLKDATVRTVLRRLESKGHVAHKVTGRIFHYRSAETPGALALRAVRDIIDRYCGGNVEQLLEAMVEDGLVERRDLKRVAKRH